MGTELCHAHAVCHSNQDSDAGVDHLPDPHTDGDGHTDTHEYPPQLNGDQHQRSYLYSDSNARAQHPHSDSRVSYHAANCYHYCHRLPLRNHYP